MEPEEIGKNVESLILKNKISKKEVAQILGIKNNVLENKLSGKEEFYIGEIIEIKKIFNLSPDDCAKLFFYKE